MLSGPDDFTGRLAAYVALAQSGAHVVALARTVGAPGASTFIGVERIADFLVWLGESGHGGVFNAGTDDPLTALDLHEIVCAALGREAKTSPVQPEEALTPFDFPARHAMSNRRARELGFDFGTVRERIPDLVRAHADGRGR